MHGQEYWLQNHILQLIQWNRKVKNYWHLSMLSLQPHDFDEAYDSLSQTVKDLQLTKMAHQHKSSFPNSFLQKNEPFFSF